MKSKGDISKRVTSQDFRPGILRWRWRLGYCPEPSQWMMDQGDSKPFCWSNGPTAAQKVDLVVSIDAAAQMERQMEVQERGWGTRTDG